MQLQMKTKTKQNKKNDIWEVVNSIIYADWVKVHPPFQVNTAWYIDLVWFQKFLQIGSEL